MKGTPLKSHVEVALSLLDAPPPGTILPPDVPGVEAEITAITDCTGKDRTRARSIALGLQAERLTRLRTVSPSIASSIDDAVAQAQSDLAAGAQAIRDQATAVGDVVAALRERAGVLREHDAKVATLADATARLADPSALDLEPGQLLWLQTQVDLLPDAIAALDADAAARAAAIADMIAAVGIDLAALTAEAYAATSSMPGTFSPADRIERNDIEAGYWTLPD